MKITRILAAAAVAGAAMLATAPSAHAAIFGPCDGYHDIEVHVGSGQCVQVNYPI